ncbi:MAG: hypothetical protein QW275_03810, partial [Candidatus Anstonellaceae archaeon]
MENIGKDEETIAYLDSLRRQLSQAMAVAEKAREKKLDPSLYVEIKPAEDVAARVEGIVGPPGISSIIRNLEYEGQSREIIAHTVVQKIARGEVCQGDKRFLVEQAVR